MLSSCPSTTTSSRWRRSPSAFETSRTTRPASASSRASSSPAAASSASNCRCPTPRAWARIYRPLFRRVAPVVGGLFGAREAYRYLPATLEGFPDAVQLAQKMRAAGLQEVSFRRLGLRAVALHMGRVAGRG